MCLMLCGSLVFVQPAAGFKPEGHRAIVRQALENFVVKAPDGSDLNFSLAAIREIQEADVFVDNWNGRKGIAEWWDPRAHCDDEMLEECSQRLIDKIDAIRGSGDRVSGTRLRQLLGQGLNVIAVLLYPLVQLQDLLLECLDVLIDELVGSLFPLGFQRKPGTEGEHDQNGKDRLQHEGGSIFL